MGKDTRELCPHCINFTDANEEVKVIREGPEFMVERTTRRCQSCNIELANFVTFKFKRMTD